jgi:hypothetical protein
VCDFGIIRSMVQEVRDGRLDEETRGKCYCWASTHKHVLLHPTINGPTRACSAYNKLRQLDAKNWWAVFGEQDLVRLGGGGFNALDRNQYSTMLPDYLSLGTSYTKIERIVPSPTKILREPMPNEKYCIYAAFGGNTPAKSEVSDEQ